MKKLVLLFTALILGSSSIMASTTDDKVAERNAYRFDKSFIFVENGITFSVYPDGEFDFYIDSRIGNLRRNVTFNSGYDYSAYAQYDDYGAVIQVENVPIYYDVYGRVTQIGDVDIRYRNERVLSVGNMFVYYNNGGLYDYHTGYINRWNRSYIYRPVHSFFVRPSLGFCFVNTRPYRRFYSPVRYTYYNPYRFNNRDRFAKIGREHRYNSIRTERARIYRNDTRVAVRENIRTSNRTVSRRNSAEDPNLTRDNNSNRNNRTTTRSTTSRDSRSIPSRSNGRSTTARKPMDSGAIRTVRTATNISQRSVARPTQRSSRSTASRSSVSKSVSKAPMTSSRSNRSISPSRTRGRQ